MPGKKKRAQLTKQIDETIKLPKKTGNGILRLLLTVDERGKLYHYSMAYINLRIFGLDNGRVLGYDNSHGYHHRHYMGKIEAVDFTTYEATVEAFDREWRAIHEQAKRNHY